MKLPIRLAAIANKIQKCDKVVDIGTDHALIPIYLIKKNICKKVIATDIKRGPIQKAYVNVVKHGLQDVIQLRIGNGLTVVENEQIDTLIISGMGGLLIRDILMRGQNTLGHIKRLVLQPNGAEYQLRKSFYDLELDIIDEQIVKDRGKYYQIIVCESGDMKPYDFIHLDIGPKIIENKSPVLKEFLNYKINRIEQILNNLNKTDTYSSIIKKDYYTLLLNNYKEALKWDVE